MKNSNKNNMKKNISLVHFEGHPNNYLIINGKYPIYHLLLTRG